MANIDGISQYRISERLIRLCRSLDSNCRSVVRTNLGILEPFTVTTAVKQGCVLSPLLFLPIQIAKVKKTNPQSGNDNNELLFADEPLAGNHQGITAISLGDEPRM